MKIIFLMIALFFVSCNSPSSKNESDVHPDENNEKDTIENDEDVSDEEIGRASCRERV